MYNERVLVVILVQDVQLDNGIETVVVGVLVGLVWAVENLVV